VIGGQGLEHPQALDDLALRGAEGALGDKTGREVVLEVVAVELEGQAGVGGGGVDLLVGVQRVAIVVDNVDLEFGAQGGRPLAEARRVQETAQVREVLLQAAPEALEVLGAELRPVDLDAHRERAPGCHARCRHGRERVSVSMNGTQIIVPQGSAARPSRYARSTRRWPPAGA
jgi:hypothetical protein